MMTTDRTLERIHALTIEVERLETALAIAREQRKRELGKGRQAGHSLVTLADAAEVSHAYVWRITKGDQR